MNCITDFLKKFVNLERDNNAKRSAILEIIKKHTGVEIKKEELDIKGETLKIKSNPVIRNEIFMHLSQIQEDLKERKIFLKIV